MANGKTKVKTTSSKRKTWSGAPQRTKTLTSNRATGVYTKTKKKIGLSKTKTKTFEHKIHSRNKPDTTKTKTVRRVKLGGEKSGYKVTAGDKKRVTTTHKYPGRKIKRIIKKTTPKKRRTVYSRRK